MKRTRLPFIALPLAMVALLVGTYLTRLPLAAERTARSPCVSLGLETYTHATQPLTLQYLDLEGAPYALSQLKGRLIIVNFWLTTCDPCLEELPALIELASRYASKGMAMLLVSTDKNVKDVTDFIAKVPRLKSLPPNVFVLHDPAGKGARALGTEKYPETYVIHPDGTWGGRVVGARNWTDRGVVDCLAQRLP